MGQPTVVEGEDWWTAADCAKYLGISPHTWRYYVSHRLPKTHPAPEPTRRFGLTPVWAPLVVRSWHAARPGRGWWRRELRMFKAGPVR